MLNSRQEALEKTAPENRNFQTEEPVIVIGGGPAGLRAAEQLNAQGVPVIIFNAERWQPYNRVKLTPLLSGDVQIGQVYQKPHFPNPDLIKQYSTHPIVAIEPQSKRVIGNFDRSFSYSKLIIATGSRAHIPSIPGIHLSGVYKFRNFDDVEKLIARSVSARACAVIGGGLLGLEAARGMANRSIETTVIEHEARLMARQLDDGAAQLLAHQIGALGINIRQGIAVKQIAGQDRVEKITLSNGDELTCDTVIICTGIRPNMEIAREAGIAVGRGITVNEFMQTSDPDIYAAGECAEYKGHIYGLVGPGLEQASIAVGHILEHQASYQGSIPTTKLKVMGGEVFSMGDVEQLVERVELNTLTFQRPDEGVYRRLVLNKGRLIGVIAIGEWSEINVLQQGVLEKTYIWPWQTWRFKRSGFLYPRGQTKSVRDWPSSATVCNCTGVTRGQIGDAIIEGCRDFQRLKHETGASTVCGSCKPLIHELLAGKPKYEPIELNKPVLIISAIVFLLSFLTYFAPGIPSRLSVVPEFTLDQIWTDGFYKQVTGFTLLALTILAAILSLRKNIKFLNIGAYSSWRLFHIIIGLLAVGILFLHTGFHLGENLNFWLLASFITVLGTGAVTGLIKSREHQLLEKGIRLGSDVPTRLPFWVHLIAFWPLPVLLALHILTVYFY